MDFLLEHGRSFTLELDTVPLHLRRYAVPLSQCRYRRFCEGEVMSQLILGNDYSIWVHDMYISAAVRLSVVSADDSLALTYMMRGAFDSFAGMEFEEGRYHFVHLRGGVRHESFISPGEFRIVHINFHPCHFVPIADQYPSFAPFLSQAQHTVTNGTIYASSVITTELSLMIDEILHCDLGFAERALFHESRVRDLLRMYVSQVLSSVPPCGEMELSLLKRVEDYIVSHRDDDLSVDALSRYAGVSRSLLQKLCHRRYGKGVYSLVIELRMKEAARLLLTTDRPVSEIASIVSDLSFASFCAAFRKYHGVTPGEYRKKRDEKFM